MCRQPEDAEIDWKSLNKLEKYCDKKKFTLND